MINIVIACDENYFNKATELWKSLKELPHKKQILCVGFDKQLEGFETARCELKNLKSYRNGFPSNRDFYVCCEGGEFLDYFDYSDDDVIVHIDADMIVQRDFNENELRILSELKFGDVLGNINTNPYTHLREEYWKLKPKKGLLYTQRMFPNFWNEPIFCAGVVVCTAKTYKEVIYNHYLSNIELMISLFDHHAAGQWLMNYICNDRGMVYFMDNDFHNGDWFINMGTSTFKGKLYDEKNRLVMFNHTKFDERYYFSNGR